MARPDPLEFPDLEEGAEDPAYPVSMPPDPIYPGQTLEPVAPPLDGVLMPALWSLLARPLARAVRELWQELGLFSRGFAPQPVALHYGRIALNAHTWERLRSRATGEAPDPALLGPEPRGVQRIADLAERTRVQLRRRSFEAYLERAATNAESMLVQLRGSLSLEATGDLARGPLHENAWAEILVPWLACTLLGLEREAADARVAEAIALEERYGAEVGRRLCANRALDEPGSVAYLTVTERIRAVHESSPFWPRLARRRRRRVEGFLDVELPLRFWGRPRVEGLKDPLVE